MLHAFYRNTTKYAFKNMKNKKMFVKTLRAKRPYKIAKVKWCSKNMQALYSYLHSELIYMLCRFIPYSIILRAELRGIEWFQFRLYVRPTKGINIGIYLYDIN